MDSDIYLTLTFISFWQKFTNEAAVLISAVLVIMGMNVVTSPPMVFYPFRRWLERKVKRYVMKPLLTCPVCMSSTWGSLVWFAYGQPLSLDWPVFCIKLAGLIYIIMMLCYKDPIQE